jgi:HPt (histidine-containing phosphotransfer) domain-containing protein
MSDFDDRFARLRTRFAAQAQQEAAEIERLAAQGDWRGIRDLAHGLAGRAGMFGQGAIGNLAREVEETIDAGGAPGDQAADLTARLRTLAQER